LEELKKMVTDRIDDEIESIISMSQSETSGLDYEKIGKEFFTVVPFDKPSQEEIGEELKKKSTEEKIGEYLKKLAHQVYEKREEQLKEDVTREIEKLVFISVIDSSWLNHLEAIDHLREGIGLRGYAGRDPLVEYKGEAFKLFESLMDSIDYDVVHRIYKIQIQPQTNEQDHQGHVHESGGTQPSAPVPKIKSAEKKIGRNDPCPCGSGLKWKKCGLINSPKHKV